MERTNLVEIIRRERDKLSTAIDILTGVDHIHRTRRRMSEQARQRISLAQKERWAIRRGKEQGKTRPVTTDKPHRPLTAAERHRISVRMKRYWAQRRKAA